MLKQSIRAAIVVAIALATTTVDGQAKVQIGTLTCIGGEGIGLVVGSKKAYQCTFAPTGEQPTEAYQASVTKIGLDVGVTGTTTMIWTVLAASQRKRGGALSGSYGGVAADVALGVGGGGGGGGKVLIGGSDKSIVLQPLSVQGQTGVSLAIGVAGMTLRRI